MITGQLGIFLNIGGLFYCFYSSRKITKSFRKIDFTSDKIIQLMKVSFLKVMNNVHYDNLVMSVPISIDAFFINLKIDVINGDGTPFLTCGKTIENASTYNI